MSWAKASVLLALSLAGCAATYQLPPRFFPLVEIREEPALPLEPLRVSTIYGSALTKDLQALLRAYPEGSTRLEALLLHEQVHSVREFQDPTFLVRYALESSFRWGEEKRGYAVEIGWLLDHQVGVDPAEYARALADGYDGMVGYGDALAWVTSVVEARR